VLDIVSSAVNESAEVAADASTCNGLFLRVRRISATKAIVAFRDSTNNNVKLRLQSIAGSTPAPTGSVIDSMASTPGVSPQFMFDLIVLSTNRAVLVVPDDRAYADLMIAVFDVSGSSPVLLRAKRIRANNRVGMDVSAAKLDASTIYATWSGGGSLSVDAITIRITGDDQISISTVSENLDSLQVASTGYLACSALDSTHIMQVCRNAATYLSAKTVEVTV